MSEPKLVETADPAKNTSRVTGPTEGDATVLTVNDKVKCYWNDEEFEDGDRIAINEKCYEASNGQWVEVTT